MATLRPLFSLGNKLFLRPANKGSGFLSMVQQHSNTTEDDSKKGGTDSKKGEKDSPKIIIPVDNDSLTRVDSKKGVTDSKKREKDSQKIESYPGCNKFPTSQSNLVFYKNCLQDRLN